MNTLFRTSIRFSIKPLRSSHHAVKARIGFEEALRYFDLAFD